MERNDSEVDLALLLRIANRDEAALADFYDRHSGLAYSVILHILRNPSEAEEVLQETFVRVWSRAETYDPLRGSPAAWLARIARNRAVDRLRSRRARAAAAGQRGAHAGDGVARSPEPVTPETPDVVRTAVATLVPEQRALIEAAFFEGYTHSELAARFGMPLGTVKTRIRMGLAALRDRLEQVR
jgi:RNA polymerase sigma-70 factor (ECF subfamily)